jgi:hypothetical protein
VKSHAQHRQPDHSKGDESTIGGYAAVHDRPAAFEGRDGCSYSVELIVEEAEESGADTVWGGFILFVKWGRLGAQSPEGHVESDYLVHADTEADARVQLGQISLAAVKTLLDQLIGERTGGASRAWWDAMRDESIES